MVYDLQLGMLATQALSALVQADASEDDADYQTFLQKSAEFCRSVRETSTDVSVPHAASQDVAAFLSAVMKTSAARSSHTKRARLRQITEVEQLITRVLRENRKPDSDEQILIAQALYATSAADFD